MLIEAVKLVNNLDLIKESNNCYRLKIPKCECIVVNKGYGWSVETDGWLRYSLGKDLMWTTLRVKSPTTWTELEGAVDQLNKFLVKEVL
jgi:hypothetical protein